MEKVIHFECNNQQVIAIKQEQNAYESTCAEIAWLTVYSVSALNCLHKDLHCTGVINVSFGETYIIADPR